MNLDDLLAKTKKHAETETLAAIEALHQLAEIERRRAFVLLGYPTLWEYALKELKYSENAAFQRITALHALQANPELEDRIREGRLTLSAICQVQRVLMAEQTQGHRTYSAAQRLDLFKRCENKSTKDVTRELALFSPLALRVQKERVVSENRTQISFVADAALVDKMRRVRDLSVARLRSPSSVPELVGLMSEVTLDKIDPMRKPQRKPKPAAVDDPAPDDPLPTDTVPMSLRNRIWREFGGRCAYVHAESGARCTSTFGLEIEHCRPRSMGGSSRDAANLRLLCKQHNQWEAIRAYGQEKMDGYLRPGGGS